MKAPPKKPIKFGATDERVPLSKAEASATFRSLRPKRASGSRSRRATWQTDNRDRWEMFETRRPKQSGH
jgi:hypothetical protein